MEVIGLAIGEMERIAKRMWFGPVLVTPEMAKQWLEKNISNRRLKPTVVRKYAHAMKSGHFYPTHQPLAFDTEGNLIDGQHRLHAIVQTGVSCWLIVAYACDLRTKIVVDQSKVRTTADCLQISGRPDITGSHVSLARAMLIGGRRTSKVDQLSNQDILAFVNANREGMDFVMKRLTRSPFSRAPVQAVVARAYYACYGDLDRLDLFCELLQTSSSDRYCQNTDGGAIKLRDWLKDNPDKIQAGNHRVEVYQRTQWVLDRFLSGTSTKQIRPTPKDLFPLVNNPLEEDGLEGLN